VIILILGTSASQFTKVLLLINASMTPIHENETALTPIDITPQTVKENSSNTLQLLDQVTIPERDLAALACRLKDICNISPTEIAPANPFTMGEKTKFWLLNSDSHQYSQIDATLQYITPHAYFWVEDGIRFNSNVAKTLIDTFENKIYPTNREFFGSEWTPGVDDDPHLYIIYAQNLGDMVAGFFSSADEYPPEISPFSNAHETIYIDSSQNLADAYTYGALAHEFQHLIHWYQDKKESSLLNEGFSEFATFINGYPTGGFDWYYTTNPDINLTDWLGRNGDNSAHYGANFLFVTYFFDRFGKPATQALVRDQKNDLFSVDDVLKQLGITDPLTHQPISADDFFLDWTLANYVHDPNVGDGRYIYHNYPTSPTTSDTEVVTTCPQASSSRTVNQYGVDYIRFTCPGDHIIKFSGATLTNLIPDDPHSGEYAFWSNKGDESDMTLSRSFDLTGASGPITLSYWTWYDLENTFDFVFLEASTDESNWVILKTPSGTDDNPTGNSFGWGYTGQSNGWIQEKVDLSQFGGKSVSLRFEYITDTAVTGDGFLVDDISIPQIEYSENFETGDGGWQGAGFTRIQNALPQTFRLALITHSSKGTTVKILTIPADRTLEIPVSIGNDGMEDVVLTVTATTRFTRELAAYQFEVK